MLKRTVTALPAELIKEPIKFLDKNDEYAYLSSCRLFKNTCQFNYDASILLQHVANGDREQAQHMLLQDPTLLLYKGRVIDKSGRLFNAITPLQYAVWALDKHMWEMLKSFMSIQDAARQVNELLVYGTEHSDHYDFNMLLSAYKDYIAKFDAADETYGNALWSYVGRAQQSLPAHVVFQYCNPEKSFYNMPTFQEPSLCSSVFLDRDSAHYHEWFFSKDLLMKQGVIRAWNGCALIVSAIHASAEILGSHHGAAAMDYAVMKTLFAIRMHERTSLVESLCASKNEYKY